LELVMIGAAEPLGALRDPGLWHATLSE
jgi:hypothetical protein